MEPITITLPGLNQIWSYFSPPESTDDVIIFPFSSGSQKFSRTIDSTRITQGKASLEDINDVLTVFELVFSRVASTPGFLMDLILSFIIPYVIFWNSYWFDWRLSETMRYATLIFFATMVNYCLYKRMRETGRRKADMQRMIEMIRPVYAKRGLKWHFSENIFCCWLELKRESSTDGEVDSGNNQESFIPQCKLFEEGENIIICAGKNLTGPDFSPPVQYRYVIFIIISCYMMVSWINTFSYFYGDYYSYYNSIDRKYRY